MWKELAEAVSRRTRRHDDDDDDDDTDDDSMTTFRSDGLALPILGSFDDGGAAGRCLFIIPV